MKKLRLQEKVQFEQGNEANGAEVRFEHSSTELSGPYYVLLALYMMQSLQEPRCPSGSWGSMCHTSIPICDAIMSLDLYVWALSKMTYVPGLAYKMHSLQKKTIYTAYRILVHIGWNVHKFGS